MKYLLLLLLPIFFVCCKGKSKYTVILKGISKDETESFFATSDSAAYWEGMKKFAAKRMSNKYLMKKGLTPPFVVIDFSVQNEDGVDISKSLPTSTFIHAQKDLQEYIKMEIE